MSDLDALTRLVQETADSLRSSEQEALRLQARISMLRDEKRVLNRLLERKQSETVNPSVAQETVAAVKPDAPVLRTYAGAFHFAEQSEQQWTEMARTAAVETGLAKLVESTWADNGVGPADVENYLRERGRDDDRDAVSGALAHLARTGRAHRTGYAKWLPGPDPDLQKTPGGAVDATPPGNITTDAAGGDELDSPPQSLSQDHNLAGERDARDHYRESDDSVAVEF